MSDAVPTVPLGAQAVEYAPTFGRFEARGMLGRGGMGLVLRAYDPKLGREVALKLIAPEKWEAASVGAQRLELEARALARLSHPNVVTVYDIGTLDEQPFIAMELIDGSSLRSWLANQPRSEREIIGMFAACAQGLTAAHAAGLIHRDFKPDNVLIGADGRPRVTDFGLVAANNTRIKGIEGTPAYMAPEQWLGEPADARVDQFAFCVALWEALCGGRPFADKDAPESTLQAAVFAGKVRDTPRPRRALAAILERGLARDPAKRWPSLATLVAALEAALTSPRRWLAAGAGGVALAVVAWLALRGDEPDACDLRGRQLDWHLVSRARITSAFLQARPLTAERGLPYTLDALERYAAAWRSADHAACVAPASALTERREACLEEARASFARVVETFATANGQVVDYASSSVDGLLEIAACEDTVALAATAPPPSDPRVRAEIAALTAATYEAFDLALRGDGARAQQRIEEVVRRASALGHAKTLAFALEEKGDLEQAAGNLAAAEVTYRAAAEAAADARLDRLAAKMWSNLIFVMTAQGGDLARATALVPVADAAVRRAGNPPHLRFIFLMSLGVLAAYQQDLATARAHFAASAALMEHDPRRRGEALVNLAMATFEAEGAAAALPRSREAARASEEANGPTHTSTALALANLADLEIRTGALVQAQADLDRALAIIDRAVSRDTGLRAAVQQGRGIVFGLRGELARARVTLDEAFAIQRAIKAPAYERGIAQAALAATLAAHGQLAEALPHYQQAVALIDEGVPNSAESHGHAMLYALALAEAGRCTDARPLVERAEPVLSKVPHFLPGLLTVRGVCARDVAILERAVAHCAAHPCDLLVAARARYHLAKRLPDRARARTLAAEARAALTAAGARIPLLDELAALP